VPAAVTDLLYARIGHDLKHPGVQIKGVTSFLKLGVKKVKTMHILLLKGKVKCKSDTDICFNF
jgi:hypothetical protein